MIKKFLATALGAAALTAGATAVPSVAAASFSSELKASNRVEQTVSRRYPAFNTVAVCDQQGRRFWCDISGSHRDCFISGHAWVRKAGWRVRLVGLNRTCF